MSVGQTHSWERATRQHQPKPIDFEALDAVIDEDDLMRNIDHDIDAFRTRKVPEE